MGGREREASQARQKGRKALLVKVVRGDDIRVFGKIGKGGNKGCAIGDTDLESGACGAGVVGGEVVGEPGYELGGRYVW